LKCPGISAHKYATASNYKVAQALNTFGYLLPPFSLSVAWCIWPHLQVLFPGIVAVVCPGSCAALLQRNRVSDMNYVYRQLISSENVLKLLIGQPSGWQAGRQGRMQNGTVSKRGSHKNVDNMPGECFIPPISLQVL